MTYIPVTLTDLVEEIVRTSSKPRISNSSELDDSAWIEEHSNLIKEYEQAYDQFSNKTMD